MKKLILLLLILNLLSCTRKANELGKNSFYFKINDVEFVPVKHHILLSGNNSLPVRFFINNNNLQLNVYHNNGAYTIGLKAILKNFNGPGFYHFKNPPANGTTSSDNYIEMIGSYGNYHSIEASPETYFRILEYKAHEYIRGIFHFELYNEQNNKIVIDKGRFDWWILD